MDDERVAGNDINTTNMQMLIKFILLDGEGKIIATVTTEPNTTESIAYYIIPMRWNTKTTVDFATSLRPFKCKEITLH